MHRIHVVTGVAAVLLWSVLLSTSLVVLGWTSRPPSLGGGVVDAQAAGPATRPAWDHATPGGRALAAAAAAQVGRTVRYDAAYAVIGYPGGDVPIDRGACSDVVIRAFRSMGVDLQVGVHKDMTGAWSAYPHLWGLSEPNTNIDHRRVPNLRVYFKREGRAVRITDRGADYWPGDVVTWVTANRNPHIGIVTSRLAPDGSRYLIVHNHGEGARVEDKLFAWRITGHYRWF